MNAFGEGKKESQKGSELFGQANNRCHVFFFSTFSGLALVFVCLLAPCITISQMTITVCLSLFVCSLRNGHQSNTNSDFFRILSFPPFY